MDGIHNERKQCTGIGERLMWTALIFPLGFDEVAHDSEYGREQIEKDRPTLHHLTSPILLRGKLLESPPNNPDSTQFHTVTQLHWKAGTPRGYCDTDVAKRKIFGDRLTGPQLGAKNSKPWRSSVTSPKVRHLKPLFFHFFLIRSRWRIPRGNGKSRASA